MGFGVEGLGFKVLGFGFRGSSGIDVADEKLSLAVSDASTGSSMALQKLVMGVEGVVYSGC